MCSPSTLREENRDCDCRFFAITMGFAAIVSLGFGVWDSVAIVTNPWSDGLTWLFAAAMIMLSVVFGFISWLKLRDYQDYIRRSRQ